MKKPDRLNTVLLRCALLVALFAVPTAGCAEGEERDMGGETVTDGGSEERDTGERHTGDGGTDGTLTSDGDTAGTVNSDGGTSDTTGTGGSADAFAWDGSIQGNLGATCAANSDCTGGLTCVKAEGTDWNRAGPPHGYCSALCAQDIDCFPFGGLCQQGHKAGVGWCVQACDPASTDVATMCRGRAAIDVGCFGGVCVPMCGLDSDCPVGRKCDPVKALCVEGPVKGAPIGASCAYDVDDPDAAQSIECAGWCWGLSLPALCSRSCILGAVGCASEDDGGIGTACIPRYEPSLGHDGDVGRCVQLCNANADCLAYGHPLIFCNKAHPVSGHGYCDSDDGTSHAEDGGADADHGTDGAITD